jgi:hypothetical protein
MGISNQARRVEKKALSMVKAWSKDLRAWGSTVSVGGESLSPTEIVARLKEICDRHQAVRTQKKLHRTSVKARNSALAKDVAFEANLTEVIRQQWGQQTLRTQSYGVPPVKRRGKLSAEKQVIAEARKEDTRRARGTKGTRQRAAITVEPKPTVVVRGIAKSEPSNGTGEDP